MTTEEFVRRAISTLMLERRYGHRGRRYVGRIVRRARRQLLRHIRDMDDADQRKLTARRIWLGAAGDAIERSRVMGRTA